MIVPKSEIDTDALRRIAEEFVTREGTDYGVVELALNEKVDQLLRQIHRGAVLIVFDETSETINLVNADEHQTLG